MAVFATLGLAALLAVIVTAGVGSVPAGPGPEPGTLRESPMVRYFHSGQLVADAHTLVAMVHYLMEPEKPMATNVEWPAFTQKDLRIPTNNAAGARKA